MRSWLLASRPKTLTASVAPVLVATALAHAEGYVVLWWISICAVFSAIFIQIGTNLFNDALDFQRGADTEHRVGPKRATQGGMLPATRVMTGGVACFFIAGLLGLPIVVKGGWPIIAIGATSLIMGYAYTGGPFPLAYKGLGDLFVFIFFGIVAVMGTFYLHTHCWSIAALVAGIQIGLLATALIAVNNLRDAPLDVIAGKRTLAVRFGPAIARWEIIILLFTPFALGIFWWQTGHRSAALWPLLSMPIAWILVAGIIRTEPSAAYNRFLGMAAALHFTFALSLSLGIARE